MSTDIFGNDSSKYPQVLGGIRFNGNSLLTFTDMGNDMFRGIIVQNWQIQYNQTVTKLRGLNTAGVVVVVAPPNGQLSIGAAITGDESYFKFLNTYGNACNVTGNQIQLLATSGFEECASGKDVFSMPSITVKGAVISGLQMAQAIENLILSSTITMDFTVLDKSKPAANP